jgi:PKD repeat protein
VDEDNNAPDVQPDYTAVLKTLGRPYDVWDVVAQASEPNTATLQNYDRVIWFSGLDTLFSGPSPTGESALSAFLTQDKCLLLSSQDYFATKGLTTFMSNTLGVAAMGNDTKHTHVTGATGSAFKDLGTYGFSYPYTNTSDTITPTVGANAAFTGDKGNAAVMVDNGVYHTSFWAFPMEALPTADARLDALNTFLNWCEGTLYAPVKAGFTGTPVSGGAPLIVTFNNSSSGQTSNLWSFGDGITSTLPSPTHTYTTPGFYTVTLKVTGPGGANTLTQPSYVKVYNPVQAGFTGTPTSGLAPLTVVFSNTASGDFDSLLWSFGDGITSTLPGPTHTFTTGGAFTVTLTASGLGGTNTATKPKYIQVSTDYKLYLPTVQR